MNNKNYDDIINLTHHESIKHKRMPKEARAAQFAPFAALTGYDEAIKETARITDTRIEISEELKVILNDKLQMINKQIKRAPTIAITYFEYDKKKSGGKYITYRGNVKRIDMIEQNVIFTDKTKIKISEIIDIQIID